MFSTSSGILFANNGESLCAEPGSIQRGEQLLRGGCCSSEMLRRMPSLCAHEKELLCAV